MVIVFAPPLSIYVHSDQFPNKCANTAVVCFWSCARCYPYQAQPLPLCTSGYMNAFFQQLDFPSVLSFLIPLSMDISAFKLHFSFSVIKSSKWLYWVSDSLLLLIFFFFWKLFYFLACQHLSHQTGRLGMQVKFLCQEKSHSWKCLLLQQERDECCVHALLPWGISHEFSLSCTPEYFSTLLSKIYKILLFIWWKLIKLKSRLTALIHFHLAFTGVYFFSSYLLNLEIAYLILWTDLYVYLPL